MAKRRAALHWRGVLGSMGIILKILNKTLLITLQIRESASLKGKKRVANI